MFIMALKRLPKGVQSILAASSQINTFKKAVEELIYNALDAESTSIAIRLHIEDSTIQVIDNGKGILKCDFKVIGQKHTTSKVRDMSSLKSAPSAYGYKGESLANLITVSQTVKIISRHENEEEKTWVKTFHNGKETRIIEITKRASKGTTVEIKGFLYNLNIQKKTINSLNELQNIKLFLEQVCLVHNNISLSLRDDSKNEIVFKIHKQRDIYQTLASLFNIKKHEVQELQVEKNDYKVRALIGKCEREINLHWIFLNGKFINNNSKLHKIVEENFNKLHHNKTINQRKIKSDNHNQEKFFFEKNIPCYFIYITCPYFDYVIGDTKNQLILEFKNRDQIKKILQKLVEFYTGEITLKEIPNPKRRLPFNNLKYNVQEETRAQVKQIMDKILGGYNKVLGVSQLQNGVKGKLIKRISRKKQKKPVLAELPSKLLTKHKKSIKDTNHIQPDLGYCKVAKYKSTIKHKIINNKSIPDNIKKRNINGRNFKIDKNQPRTKIKENDFYNISVSNVHQSKEVAKNIILKESKLKKSPKKEKRYALNNFKHDKLLSRKLKKNTNLIEKRSKSVALIAEKFLKGNMKNVIPNRDLKNQNHFIKSNHDHRNNVVNYDVDHVFLPPKVTRNLIEHNVWHKIKQNNFKTTYDLVQTVIRSQQKLLSAKKDNLSVNRICSPLNNFQYSSILSKQWPNNSVISKFTFESHHYPKNNTFLTKNVDTCNTITKKENSRFITKQSRDNFSDPCEKLQDKFSNEPKQYASIYKRNKYYVNCVKQNIEESSYTIEFSKTCISNKCEKGFNTQTCNQTNDINTYTQIKNSDDNNEPIFECALIAANTYTISPSNIPFKDDIQYKWPVENDKYNNEQCTSDKSHEPNNTLQYSERSSHNTFTVERKEEDENKHERNLNVIFVSKSQNSNTNISDINPFNICETILDSRDENANELGHQFDANITMNDSLLQSRQGVEVNHEVPSVNVIESISHHFSNTINVESMKHTEKIQETIIKSQYIQDFAKENVQATQDLDTINKKACSTFVSNHFDFKDRLRFLPKGMSQIFAVCNSKTACDYNLEKDYFDDSIYNNFANHVQVNVETYEPNIQNLKDQTTANIQKVNDKRNKENASLIFDGESLKGAKVLGQVDNKFIAVIMREKGDPEESMEYLILFDQHAVHERIRLEKNLQDYLVDDQWRSIPLDDIALKLSKDEVLYLHNYKTKFTQFGLQWTILADDEVLLNAIPEAILGKNPREVEKVIKAVKNLITEEIINIKMQQGCVSMYPKTIMDLVFSEACRYAIKFGDSLSKDSCKELLQALSECKTPFQCAHGRPVMAVLMDCNRIKQEYKVNAKKIKEFQCMRY